METLYIMENIEWFVNLFAYVLLNFLWPQKYFGEIFKYRHLVCFSVGKWISPLDSFESLALSSTTITRHGFSRQPNAPVDDSSSGGSEPLQFTGNWFIDAGILGEVSKW